jgi:hypothetical protein
MMTKPSTLQTKHRFAIAGMAAALAIAPIAVAGSAQAQVYVRPFAYSYERPAAEEPAPYGSYRSVSRILAREGYRLVGPLGSRGDQVVATGVDSAGRRMRFFIDPYEGEVLQSRPIASAHAYEAPGEAGYSTSPNDAPSAPSSEPRVIPGLSEETPPAAEPRAEAGQRKNRSPRAKLTPQSQTAAPSTAAEPPLPHASAVKLDPGSRRAVTPPRPAAGPKPPAPSAPPTADAKAPSESVAPAPASLAQPAAASTPTAAAPAAVAPTQPAASAPAASQGAADGTQSAAVAQPAASEPPAPVTPASASPSPAAAPAASATAAPAKPEAAAPDSKAQNGVGG